MEQTKRVGTNSLKISKRRSTTQRTVCLKASLGSWPKRTDKENKGRKLRQTLSSVAEKGQLRFDF